MTTSILLTEMITLVSDYRFIALTLGFWTGVCAMMFVALLVHFIYKFFDAVRKDYQKTVQSISEINNAIKTMQNQDPAKIMCYKSLFITILEVTLKSLYRYYNHSLVNEKPRDCSAQDGHSRSEFKPKIWRRNTPNTEENVDNNNNTKTENNSTSESAKHSDSILHNLVKMPSSL